jgi:hypothetical protein
MEWSLLSKVVGSEATRKSTALSLRSAVSLSTARRCEPYRESFTDLPCYNAVLQWFRSAICRAISSGA